MMQMNNNAAMLIQRMNQFTQANAQARQFQEMFRTKTPEEKRQFVENMCRERGTTPEDVARSLGIQIPSQR